MKNSTELFQDIIAGNIAGRGTGIYSICSAHPVVLAASMMQAKKDRSLLLVESTSNQVDQYGGYTGMTPSGFVTYVDEIAHSVGFPAERIILGGDHLGPNSWQKLPADTAMAEAETLIAAYVAAGFTKIHLDASMYCADDAGDRSKPLDDAVVSARAARLCRVAEETWKGMPARGPEPIYIIGTEVPIPGGTKEAEEGVIPTSPDAAARTIEITRKAFQKQGLQDAWDRVCGLVVQPGVEFGDDQVFYYDRSHPSAAGLREMIAGYPGMVYEAHSTDYQSEEALRALVEDHFCILKVGPWVTFAYREAIFALSFMEDELLAGSKPDKRSHVREILDLTMVNRPEYWKPYYHGTPRQQAFKRRYSFSDRSRYYWPVPEIQKAVDRLVRNLNETGIPLSLLSQFMPGQYLQVSEGRIRNRPEELITARIMDITGIYSRACGI